MGRHDDGRYHSYDSGDRGHQGNNHSNRHRNGSGRIHREGYGHSYNHAYSYDQSREQHRHTHHDSYPPTDRIRIRNQPDPNIFLSFTHCEPVPAGLAFMPPPSLSSQGGYVPQYLEPSIYPPALNEAHSTNECPADVSQCMPLQSIAPSDACLIPTNLKFEAEGIMPTLPYYLLPAGIMTPLLKQSREEFYAPLDPTKLRLPLPKRPDERLLKAIDSYYIEVHRPNKENDGWSKLFLESSERQASDITKTEDELK